MSSGVKKRRCNNPKCQQYFEPTYERQVNCSVKCILASARLAMTDKAKEKRIV